MLIGILLTMAAGLGIYSLFDDDDASDRQNGTVQGDEDDNLFVSSELATSIEAIATAQGVSDAEAAAFLGLATVVPGTLNVSTGAGDDLVFGSSGDDIIRTGDGEDEVLAGAGDDFVDLGDGDDFMSFAGDNIDENTENALGAQDAGDDEIFGRKGNDIIVDVLGSNTISGNEGNDDLVTLDAETDGSVTPDTVFGGWGADAITVDEGDTVTTGVGPDRVIVDVDNAGAIDAQYQVVTITDFTVGQDILALDDTNGTFDAIDPNSDITVSNSGGDTIVSLNGIALVRLEGVDTLSRNDIIVLG